MNFKLLATAAVAAGLALGLASSASATALTVDSGWTYDQIDAAATDSEDSPWTFTFATGGHFRLTDAFNLGDTFNLFDGATLVATSTFFATSPLSPVGDPNGEAAWENSDYRHIDLNLGAGAHSLRVQGDGAGGLAAGLYVRADSGGVPEPATWAMMLVGFGGLGAVLRASRRQATATA